MKRRVKGEVMGKKKEKEKEKEKKGGESVPLGLILQFDHWSFVCVDSPKRYT